MNWFYYWLSCFVGIVIIYIIYKIKAHIINVEHKDKSLRDEPLSRLRPWPDPPEVKDSDVDLACPICGTICWPKDIIATVGEPLEMNFYCKNCGDNSGPIKDLKKPLEPSPLQEGDKEEMEIVDKELFDKFIGEDNE